MAKKATAKKLVIKKKNRLNLDPRNHPDHSARYRLVFSSHSTDDEAAARFRPRLVPMTLGLCSKMGGSSKPTGLGMDDASRHESQFHDGQMMPT